MNEENLKAALRSLPHGPEFRFLDRIDDLVPGESGKGDYLIRGDEAFLRGHFPGDPLFPGVLLLEAAAQLAGSVAQCDPRLPPLPGLKLSGVRQVKIFGSARPGESLTIQARISGRMGKLIQAEAQVYRGTELLMTGDFILSGA
jgi:3-hydroxyacyl-[acyl-carrier-protein] dehydratase